MLHHDAQLIKPCLRHTSLQVVVCKNALRSRSVNPLLGPVYRPSTSDFVEQPSAREGRPSPHPLEKYGNACGSAEAPGIDPCFQMVRLFDLLQYLNDPLGLRDTAAA